MARYDVFIAPDPGSGYLLDVQSDLLEGLNTRVVVPLMPADRAPAPAALLNPVFEIEGAPFVMVTQFLSAVPATMTRRPGFSLSGSADRITRALNMLLHGF